MANLTTLEKEIIDATAFRMKRFNNRQDYLAALARALENIEDDDFDNLSDEAARWYKAACDAINGNEEIPDFEPDDEEAADDDAEADGDHDGDEDDSDAGDDDDADDADGDEADEGDEDADEADAEEAEEPEPEPAAKPTAKKPAKGSAAKEPKEAKKAPVKQPEATPELIAKARAAKAKEPKPKKRKNPLPKTRYDDLTGEKNRYGFYKGTKTDEAISMFEKGAKMAEVTEYLGDTYYNLIKALREAGHSVEKNDSGQIVLRHKDDVGGKKAKAK